MSGLSIWEGDTFDANMLRSLVVKQDKKFVAAVKKAHPELPTRTPARPKRVPKRSVLGSPDVSHEKEVIASLVDGADVGAVLRSVSKRLHVTIAQIVGRSRNSQIVKARHTVFYLLFEGGYSTTEIGRMFGVDHTSVGYSIRNYRRKHNLVKQGLTGAVNNGGR